MVKQENRGIRRPRPPSSVISENYNPAAAANGNQLQRHQQKKFYPVGWDEIEEIDGLLKSKRILEGSSDMLGKMNSDRVFRRMDDLWPDPAKQVVFLRLVVITARSNQEDIRQTTHTFLRKTLESKLIANVFDKFFLQIIVTQPHIDAIVHTFLGLLFLAWQMFPSKMAESDMMVKTLHVVREIRDKHAQNDRFPTKESVELLDRLDVIIQDRRRKVEAQANAQNQAGSSHRDRGRECKDSSGPPPDDFRNLPVELEADDILTENQHVYLRRAIVRGSYENDLHYLDVQFRLLREDLCRPLRNGIRQFREAENKSNGSRGDELLVYRDVKIIGSELNKQSGQVLVYVRLCERDQRRRMLKRFKFGSLVCFSGDDFYSDLLFATVIDRENISTRRGPNQEYPHLTDGISQTKGAIGLQMDARNVPNFDASLAYSMVESPAFYECYRHVLGALQNIIPVNNMDPNQSVPFSRYLVHMELTPVVPKYQRIRGMALHKFDFKCLLRTPNNFASTSCTSQQLTTIFKPEDFGMDRSQFGALEYALRSELAVIQGPPGTGKTYLGLKIVQLLFANESIWLERVERPKNFNLVEVEQRPMLVVCYTNHALDQFLEGIMEFVDDGILRVGGQSRSVKLERINLSNLREDLRDYLTITARSNFFNCRSEMQEKAIELDRSEKELALAEKSGFTIPKIGWKLFAPLLEGWKGSAFEAIIGDDFRALEHWLIQAKSIKFTLDVAYVKYITQNFLISEDITKILSFYLYNEEADAEYRERLTDALTHRRTKELFAQKLYEWFTGLSNNEKTFLQEFPRIQMIVTVQTFLGLDDEVAVELLMNGQDVQSLIEHIGAIPDSVRRKTQAQSTLDFNQELYQELVSTEAIDNDGNHDHDANANCDGDDEHDLQADGEDTDRRMHDYGPDLDIEKHSSAAEQLTNGANILEWRARSEKFRMLFSSNQLQPMSDEEASGLMESTEDPWALPLLTRWRLYRNWVQKWRQVKTYKKERLTREYCEKRKEFEELRAQSNTMLMKRAKVIGMTTTAASRLQAALRSVKPRIVVVEEAAEVFEQHILASLTECCEHLILIGDHQQLRPSPEDYHLGKDYHLDISLFERLVLNGFAYKRLNNQHRMRPEIARTLMPHFYTDLQDHPSVHKYPDILGMQKNLFFLKHSIAEASKAGDDDFRSHSNVFEADFVVRLTNYLTQQGYEASQINILCSYSDQFLYIRNKINHLFGRGHGIRVENVDNYQGEECDIIILSLVRSNNQQRKIGFLNVHNRVCVAMSRARKGFYVFGNIDFLAENCANDLWKNIKQSLSEGAFLGNSLPIVCQMHGTKQEIRNAFEFVEKASEGGCQLPCDFRMDCGHTCRKPCHPHDLEHKKGMCTEKCERTCGNGRHKCERLCYQDCGECTVDVLKKLPCGHNCNGPCSAKEDEMECQIACQLTLHCGHKCAKKCGQPHTVDCEEKVTKSLPCGHELQVDCHIPPASVKCTRMVNKQFPLCGHVVDIECSLDLTAVQCAHPCGQSLPECVHKCEGTCGKCRFGRLHVECRQDCKRILICGHECRSKCARVCLPCELPCETACPHSRCTTKGKKGRNCGQPCPPCAEQCVNKCAHRKCTKHCGELCDVDSCNQSCDKLLQCSPKQEGKEGFYIVHPCIGVCGEDCLNVCRICNPDKYAEITEIFFGTEDEENARFVQLDDCYHIFEVTGLDQAIQTQLGGVDDSQDGSSAIVVIKCPKCLTPIRRSKRYIKLLNKRAQQIEQVKQKIIGDKTKKELIGEWEAILKNMQELPLFKHSSLILEHFNAMPRIKNRMEEIVKTLMNIQTTQITCNWIIVAENIKSLLNEFSRAFLRIYCLSFHGLISAADTPCLAPLLSAFDISHLAEFLYLDLCQLIDYLANAKLLTIASSTLEGLSSELGRHNFLFNLFKWIDMSLRKDQLKDIDSLEEALLTKLLYGLFSAKGFVDQKDELETQFKKLIQLRPMSGLLGITRQEMVQIKKALSTSGRGGKWYTCSRGHAYNIANCGRALERGQCPECMEIIGGERHQHVGTSREVPELNQAINGKIRRDPFRIFW